MIKKVDITGSPVNFKHAKSRVCGDVIEVRRYLHLSKEMSIRKLDATHYVVISTGEVLECQINDNRSESRYQMSVSFGNMRSIVNANFTGGLDQSLVTLTYRENMRDEKRLYRDFKSFRHRLETFTGYRLSYLAAVEPQARGAWHLHVLYKRLDGQMLYIPQKDLMRLWGHGGVNVKRLKDVDNVGAYLSAYLMNLSVEEFVSIETGSTIVSGQTDKKYVKGERLKLYPPGMNFYRCSRDLLRPEWKDLEELTDKEKAVARNCPPVYRKAMMVQDDDKILQVVEYTQYNMARQAPPPISLG